MASYKVQFMQELYGYTTYRNSIIFLKPKWEFAMMLFQCSHTSLCGVALYPHGDRWCSHFIAAGNTNVVASHSLEPRDVILERRHCDVDQPSHCHLPLPPTHLFKLGWNRTCVRTDWRINSYNQQQQFVQSLPWCDILLWERNHQVQVSSSTPTY